MNRKVVLGVGGGALVGAVLGWWLRGPPEHERVVPLPVVMIPQQRAPVSPAPGPAVERPRNRVEAPGDAPTYERAVRVVADYAGDGFIRCSVGDTIPDGPVLGIDRARVEDGLLIGTVEEPKGQARVHLPEDSHSDPPRLVVRWWGAWPGDDGHCDVVPAERVAVSGRVVDSAGVGIVGEVGNLVDGTVPTGADGSFTFQCWAGAECPLSARRSVSDRWGPFVTLVTDIPMDGVQIVLDPLPTQDLKTYLEERVAEDERLARQPDPLRLALADPQLPTDARSMVQEWLDEQSESRTITRTLLAEVDSD